MTTPYNMSTALVDRTKKKRRALSDEDGDSSNLQNTLPALKSKNTKLKKKAKIQDEDELMEDALPSAGGYGAAASDWDHVPRKIETSMQERENADDYQTTTTLREIVKIQNEEETNVDGLSERESGSEEGTVVMEDQMQSQVEDGDSEEEGTVVANDHVQDQDGRGDVGEESLKESENSTQVRSEQFGHENAMEEDGEESENEHFEQEEEDDDLPLASQVGESRVETVEYLGENYSRSKAHKAKRLVEFLARRKMRLEDYLDEDLRPAVQENAWLGEKKEEMEWSKDLINRLVDLSKHIPKQEDFNQALREELAKRRGGLRQIRPNEVCRITDRLREAEAKAKAKEEAERISED
ncbi:hypothetical protein HII31_11547 [Pseudocercospora fuligena]|uniref:Uncharacterized protein n=1 Tax=Pseudocercospora fuligena TaxID=685502 RepID=A0A8H6R9R2_9PEZI|nr:hypothetical protein HII31_11547 [Pseudocercospora fuligena]